MHAKTTPSRAAHANGESPSPLVGAAGRAPTSALEVADWRRRVAGLYAEVRGIENPERAHGHWRLGRDELFATHPQSPLPPGDVRRARGLPYFAYDPAMRFELTVQPPPASRTHVIPTDGDDVTTLRSIGVVELPAPLSVPLDVWWLEQYGGGIFLPLRDASAGSTTYGGGRYLLDTAKGADLGGTSGRIVVDLNFLYHPSCRYSSEWRCPLAPPENTIEAEVLAGERL